MFKTVLEAHVGEDHWPTLVAAHQAGNDRLPEQMVQTMLVQDTADRTLWRGISVWHSREALQEYRKSMDTPGGVLMFRAAVAEPIDLRGGIARRAGSQRSLSGAAVSRQRDERRNIMQQDTESFALGPNHVRFLLSGSQTGGRFSLTEFTAAPPPAPSAPPHVHQDADETLYILEGEFQFVREGQKSPAPPGSFIFVPRGTGHAVENVGTAPGRMLVILTPPGFEQFWKERSDLMAANAGNVDPAVLFALQEKDHMDTGGEVRHFEKD